MNIDLNFLIFGYNNKGGPVLNLEAFEGFLSLDRHVTRAGSIAKVCDHFDPTALKID